jgi:hypothetical protein
MYSGQLTSRAPVDMVSGREARVQHPPSHAVAFRCEDAAFRWTYRSRELWIEASKCGVGQLPQHAHAPWLKGTQLSAEMGSRTCTEERFTDFTAIAPNSFSAEARILGVCPALNGVHEIMSCLQEPIQEGRVRLERGHAANLSQYGVQLVSKIVGPVERPEPAEGRWRVPADEEEVNIASGRRIDVEFGRTHNARCCEQTLPCTPIGFCSPTRSGLSHGAEHA